MMFYLYVCLCKVSGSQELELQTGASCRGVATPFGRAAGVLSGLSHLSSPSHISFYHLNKIGICIPSSHINSLRATDN